MKIVVALLVFIALMMSSIILFLPVKAGTRTISVPDDYLKIQEAVDAANAGDIVLVKKGNYHQNVTINKQVSLIGENSETTMIYGFRSYNILAPDTTIQINADGVLISNFTLTNCSVGISANGNRIQLVSNVIDCYPTGIYFAGSNGTIANNTVTSSQYGYIAIIGSNNSICGNTITNGSLELEGSFNSMDINSVERINLEKSNSNTMSRNNCTHLFLSENCSYNTFFGNVFDGEGKGNYGVRIWGSDNVFSENYFSNASYGVSLGHTVFSPVRNKFYHNMFINNNEGHVELTNSNWSDNFWDNGVEGNYYDDYTGLDNNRDGIGDSPYRIEETRYEESLEQEITVVFFEDKYPLMEPYDIENNMVVVPPPEPFTTLLVTTASIAAALLAVGILIYFKKRKG